MQHVDRPRWLLLDTAQQKRPFCGASLMAWQMHYEDLECSMYDNQRDHDLVGGMLSVFAVSVWLVHYSVALSPTS